MDKEGRVEVRHKEDKGGKEDKDNKVDKGGGAEEEDENNFISFLIRKTQKLQI